MKEGTEPTRTPEDVRLIKRLHRYANMQREEILYLRESLYKAENSLERLRAFVEKGLIS